MKEHTGFSRREERVQDDPLEALRKKVIENRYRGKYQIENQELLNLIDRVQAADKKLKELQLQPEAAQK